MNKSKTPLDALAQAVGARLDVAFIQLPGANGDGQFPATASRDYEERLIELARSRSLDPAEWKRLGSAFFMAGIAVMLASVSGFDRRGLLALAERLHPGASEAAVFSRWLERTPVRPSRLLPLISAGATHAA